MTPFELLSGLGSMASLLGLGLQVKELSADDDHNLIALKSFQSITVSAFRWKHVHNHYHLLLRDIRQMHEFALATPESRVSTGHITDLLKSLRTFDQKAENFRRDVNVFLDAPVREHVFSNSEVEKIERDVAKCFNQKRAKLAIETYNAQRDAIKTHDAVCERLDKIIEVGNGNVTHKESLTIYRTMIPLYDQFNSVILHTDKVLINTIDFYEIVHEFV
ncbi:hypothetical protein [Devosia sp. CAU 1758]